MGNDSLNGIPLTEKLEGLRQTILLLGQIHVLNSDDSDQNKMLDQAIDIVRQHQAELSSPLISKLREARRKLYDVKDTNGFMMAMSIVEQHEHSAVEFPTLKAAMALYNSQKSDTSGPCDMAGMMAVLASIPEKPCPYVVTDGVSSYCRLAEQNGAMPVEKDVVERVASAIESVQLFSRYNGWTKDRVEGLPVEICRYGNDGEDEIVVIERRTHDERAALKECVRRERAKAAITAMGEESIRKDEQRVKPDCLADNQSPSPESDDLIRDLAWYLNVAASRPNDFKPENAWPVLDRARGHLKIIPDSLPEAIKNNPQNHACSGYSDINEAAFQFAYTEWKRPKSQIPSETGALQTFLKRYLYAIREHQPEVRQREIRVVEEQADKFISEAKLSAYGPGDWDNECEGDFGNWSDWREHFIKHVSDLQQREVSLPQAHFIRGKILDALGNSLEQEQFDRNGQLPTVTKVMEAIRPYLRVMEPDSKECNCNPHGFVSTKCKICNWGPIDEAAFSKAEEQYLDGASFGARSDDEYRMMPTNRIRAFLMAYEAAKTPEPVSVSLKAMADVVYDADALSYNSKDAWCMEIAKALLNAAGVKYVD